MARTKTAGANVPVPQTREEAAASISTVGELRRQVARLEADMNDELAAVKLRFETSAAPIGATIEERVKGLSIYAEANRAALTGNGKTKTVDMGTGLLQWRRRPPKVRITGAEKVIARLKELALGRFLRVSEEIDKEAMLREPAVARTVAGVGIGSEGEDFIVEPFEAALAAETKA